MKIYIDTQLWARVAEERESPFYMGENYVSKVRVYFNSIPYKWYPTMKFLKANNRRKGPIGYDTSGYGIETVYNLKGYESSEWHFFDFTLSAWEGIVDTPGSLDITLIINHIDDDGNVNKQHLINFKNHVMKTTIFGDDNNVIVIGDDP